MLTAYYLVLVQGTLGALDTLWYHEYQQRLPRNASAKVELRLHASRDFAYACLFFLLAWFRCSGGWAMAFLTLLAFEICITLWDFIEEDISRRLPAGERAMHTVMAIVYGAFLANIIPVMWHNRLLPTALSSIRPSWLAWTLTCFAIGVFLSGIRDVVASFCMKV